MFLAIILIFCSCQINIGFERRKFPCQFETKCTCIGTEKTVLLADCSGQGLTNIPTIPNNVQNVSFSNNNISEIQNDTFKNNTRLQHLDLSRNKIDQLDTKSFEGLENLLTLIMNNNNISYSGLSLRNAFKPLVKIIHLDLKNNSKQYVEPNISSLLNLETLKIDHFAGTKATFGIQFKTLRNLTNLDLSGFSGYCRMQILTPNTFEYLPQLQYFDLSKCRINSIWKGTFKNMTLLRYLDLSDNRCLKFTGVENVTFDLPSTSIKILKINKVHQTFALNTEVRKCQIKHLRDTKLTEMYVDSNRLQLLEPGALNFLPKTLKILSVADNQFTYGEYIQDIYTTTVQSVNMSFQAMSHYLKNADEPCDHIQPNTGYCNTRISPINTEDLERKELPDNNTLQSSVLFVPYQLRTFHFRQCKLRYYFPKVHLSNNLLEYIDASYNTFYEWRGPILNLNHLKFLDLSYNFCSNVSTVFFISGPNLTTLFVQNNLLGFVLPDDKEGKTLAPLTKLEILNLAQNRIPSIPKVFFNSQKALRKFNLSGNMLENVDFWISHMRNLSFLDLSLNRLSVLDPWFTGQLDQLSQNNPRLTIDITGNPIKCTCESMEFVKWLSTTKVHLPNFFKQKCQSLHQNQLYLNNSKHIYDILKKECSSYSTTIVAVSFFMVIFVIILISGILFRYRWKIRYLYYMVKSKHQGYIKPIPPDDDRDFIYDVFISYADEDVDFVHSKFLKHVEEEMEITCCIHKRDFTPGNDIATNITSAIHNCRKTVVMMSYNFLNSYWCMFEYNMARMESIYSRNNENMIFLIFLEQISSKDLPLNVLELVQSQSYIEYPNDEYGDRVFWAKIKETLSS